MQKKPKLEMGPVATAACNAISKCKSKLPWLVIAKATRQTLINAATGLDDAGETPAAVHAVRLRALAKLLSIFETNGNNMVALWDDRGVRTAVLRAADNAAADLRHKGLQFLLHLAGNTRRRSEKAREQAIQSMWSDERVPRVVIQSLKGVLESAVGSAMRASNLFSIRIAECICRNGGAAMITKVQENDGFMQAMFDLIGAADQLKPADAASVCTTLRALQESSEASRAMIAAEPGLLSAVYMLSTTSGVVRESASELFVGLLRDPSTAAAVWANPTYRRSLKTAVMGSEAVAAKDALNAVCSVARSCGDEVWKDADLMSAVVDLVDRHPRHLRKGKPSTPRMKQYEAAAGVLTTVSRHCSNATRAAMWTDARIAHAIVASACCNRQSHVHCRDNSVGTLCNLAICKDTAVAMATVDGVMDALLAGVVANRSEYCRDAAVEGLLYLTEAVPTFAAAIVRKSPGLVGITRTAAALPVKPKDTPYRSRLRANCKKLLPLLEESVPATDNDDDDDDGDGSYNASDDTNDSDHRGGSRDELYCICQKPDDGRGMIQCVDCTEW